MKKRILSILMILGIGLQILAQNVAIPDVNFKNYLLSNGSINTNGDSEIQVSEASAYSSAINCQNMSISDLTGIEAFTSIVRINCISNNLSSIDISNNTALTQLICSANNISNLDISNNTALTILQCHSNNLTSLDISSNNALTQIWCELNNLTSLDVSNKTSVN